VKKGRDTLKRELDSLDLLLYPLLRWLITSNRAHIRRLEPEERLDAITSEHQFVFVSCTPEKEAQFKKLASDMGKYCL